MICISTCLYIFEAWRLLQINRQIERVALAAEAINLHHPRRESAKQSLRSKDCGGKSGLPGQSAR